MPSTNNPQIYVSGHSFDLHSMCNFCSIGNHNNAPVVSQDRNIVAIQAASQIHSELHEQNSSPLQTRRCSPPKLHQLWENSVVLPPAISNSQNLSGILQSHIPSYTCASFHNPSISSSIPKSNIVLCRSCSLPHDRMELPSHFQIASPPCKKNTSPKVSTHLDFKPITCPSVSSYSSTNCFPNLTPCSKSLDSKSLDSKSTPSSTQPSSNFVPSKANCLQFLQRNPSQVILENKVASQDSQMSSRDLSPLCLQTEVEQSLTITPPPPSQIQKQTIIPCAKSHSCQNQPPSKSCTTSISLPKTQQSSNFSCGSLIPLFFNYTALQLEQITPPKGSQVLNSSTIENITPSKNTLNSSENILYGTDSPPLPSKLPCQTSKPRFLNSCKPSQTSLASSCKSHTPPSSSCNSSDTSPSNQQSYCGERTKTSHCSTTTKSMSPLHSFPCTKNASPLPSSNKQLPLQSPPKSKLYSCKHSKEIPISQTNLESKNTISSMPKCFNFSVPKSLATCPECLTYCIDSPHGYSQTIKATPRENHSSFMCLPFGPRALNSQPSMNHSCTQTSSKTQSHRFLKHQK